MFISAAVQFCGTAVPGPKLPASYPEIGQFAVPAGQSWM